MKKRWMSSESRVPPSLSARHWTDFCNDSVVPSEDARERPHLASPLLLPSDHCGPTTGADSQCADYSEYIAPVDARRAYLTSFTGSAGCAVITEDEARLWTDGRYFLQAEKQLSEG